MMTQKDDNVPANPSRAYSLRQFNQDTYEYELVDILYDKTEAEKARHNLADKSLLPVVVTVDTVH